MVLERDEGVDVAWRSALHRGDHVHVALPRPLGVEHGRVCGVVGMAVVVPEDVDLGAVVLLADLHVLTVVDQVSHLRLLALDVAHGPHLGDQRIPRPADEQAADLVRVALRPVALDRLQRAPRHAQLLLAIQPGRQVAIAGVGKDRDDHALADRLRELADPPERGAAGVADEQSLAGGDRAREVVSRLGRGPPHLVRDRGLPDPGHDRGRKVLQAFEPVERVRRLDGDGLDRAVVLLEPGGGAHERPRGAQAGHEMSDPAGRLLQDLARGAFIVRARVGRVGVLVRVEVSVGIGRDDVAHHADRAVRAFAGVAEDDLGAVREDQRLALGADVLRHHELHPVALRRPEQRVGHACVARRGVDDGLLVRQRPGALAVLDHGESRPVLDRAAGVEPLGLGVDLDVRVLVLEQADAEQRCIAYPRHDAGALGQTHVHQG